ncbi:uncharacterized protein LOC117089281 [Trachypithecus francoisi]|uniref:uncharacterized protein LOC117089281 n=1 Tax=Trachypithecus francoisi TaxID=54180 RepID=UPI00141BF26B|nr:uncharacterized protein LOC117089281 [Trachypithecus francoisi]
MSPRVPSSAPFRGAAAPANREPRCASVGCHSAVNRQSTVCWPQAPQLSVNLSVSRQRAAFFRSYIPWFIHSETSEVFLEEVWLQTLQEPTSTCQGRDGVQAMEIPCSWSQEDEVWAQRLMA